MSYGNWNGRGGERIIPISIEGGNPTPSPTIKTPSPFHPTPSKPTYPKDAPRIFPPNPSDSYPHPQNNRGSLPQKSGAHPDFRSFELDEMDALAQALEQKRAGEGGGSSEDGGRPVMPSRNPGYNYAEKEGEPENVTNVQTNQTMQHVQMGFVLPANQDTQGGLATTAPYPSANQMFGPPQS